MAELLSKQNMSNWTDGILIGISKVTTEKLLTPILGNATLMSGAVKLVAGSMITGQKFGKVGNIVGQGLQIDGVEDIALVIINKTNGLFGLLNSNKEESSPAVQVL